MQTAIAPTHATFTVEQDYPLSPERVFNAWSKPAEKARWFASSGGRHHLDFRIGGQESVQDTPEGPGWTFTSVYQEIRPAELIVYTSTMSQASTLATVSTTTVEFTPRDSGTRLTLTEQGTFLSDLELPAWREHGTRQWLEKLRTHLLALDA